MKITCGLFLYNIINKKFLLCHATRSKPNLWSIPKGLRDEGETIEEAAFRELYEETGLKKEELNLMFMQALPPVKYKKQSKLLESFLTVVSLPTDCELTCHSHVSKGYPEIDKYRWVSLDEMYRMAHESQVANLGKIKEYLDGVFFPDPVEVKNK